MLVSFRNISVVAIIEKRTGQMVWRLGDDVLRPLIGDQYARLVQLHPGLVPAHGVDIEHAGVPERPLLEADVAPFVEVHGNARRGHHPDLLQRGVSLRPPRRARLAVAAQPGHAEDAPHVARARALPPGELGDTVEPPAAREVLRRRRVHGMEVGVVADVVPAERRDHVRPPALLEDARLLPHDLERGPDPPRGEDLRHALRRVVAGGKEVVLGVEPQDHPHLGLGRANRRHSAQKQHQSAEDPACHSRSSERKLHFGRSARVRSPTRAAAIRSSQPSSSARWALSSKPK